MAVGDSGNDGMSMREKALLKRRINKQHNSNFKAGYVPINENYLHKTGLRGRKSFLVYGVVAVLFIIVVSNLLVTLVLLSVLRIGYGMEGLEFLPPDGVEQLSYLIKFLVPSDMGTVVPSNGQIGGFANRDFNVYGSKGEKIELRTNVASVNPSSISMGPTETVISNVDSFRVINPSNGKMVFSSDYKDFGLPMSVKSINVRKARLSRISSPINKTLTVKTKRQIHLLGSEGINMASKEVVWTTNEDLILKSLNGSIYIIGMKGMFINATANLPLPNIRMKSSSQFKICVCKHSKRLFRIPVSNTNGDRYYNCSNAVMSGDVNPCA